MVDPPLKETKPHGTSNHDEDADSDSGDEAWADASENPAEQTSAVKHDSETESFPLPDVNNNASASTDKELLDAVLELTDEETQLLLKKATDLKDQGNKLFLSSEWDGALDQYHLALKTVPKREQTGPLIPADAKGKGRRANLDEDNENDDEPPSKSEEQTNTKAVAEDPLKDMTELQRECAMARSVINGNIAACLAKKGSHEDAVKFCTEALSDVPNYYKALHRRAVSNEALDTWTSLAAAQRDYTSLLEILPTSNPLRPKVQISLRIIKPKVEAAQKKETDEMLSKLKDLGNTVLGKFGMSTDNFKFTPNGSGGYSMNFSQ